MSFIMYGGRPESYDIVNKISGIYRKEVNSPENLSNTKTIKKSPSKKSSPKKKSSQNKKKSNFKPVMYVYYYVKDNSPINEAD